MWPVPAMPSLLRRWSRFWKKAAACCCWLAVMLSRTPRSGWMLTSWSLWPCCPLPTASDQKHRKRSATLPNRVLPLRSSPAIIPLPSARWPARRALRLDTDEKVAEAVRTCTVFGRVTPAQKRKFVKALQADGHTVAMTGDGVNDVLALKDADCGIAMASGAQAASQVAQLVLLESDFSGLPAVVAEGRRVINNIQRSASLFLVKNIFSFLLTFISLFITMPYPLQPLQLSLLSMVTIGIPSFILALEPNHEMVHGKFIQNVLRAALPGGLSDLLLILGIEAFVFAFELPIGTLTTLTTLLLLAVGMAVLWDVCKPFTVAHGVLWGGMLILAGAAIALLGGFLGLERLDMRGMLILIAFLLLVVQTLHSMERGLTAVGEAAALVWKRLPRKSKAEKNY